MTHETGDVRQVARDAWDAAVRECMGTTPDHSQSHELVTAREAYVGKLASPPAPSGWQQRIAAMDPWVATQHDDYRCFFCGIYREDEGEAQQEHPPQCLWQNAVDALPPAHTDWRTLIAPLVHFVARERALRDAQGKGGQSVGDSPRISPSVLKELERMLAPVMAQIEKTGALPPAPEMKDDQMPTDEELVESGMRIVRQLLDESRRPDAKDAIPPQSTSREAKLREVFEACRAHLRRRHGCNNFDDFNVETLEWPTDHDFEVEDAIPPGPEGATARPCRMCGGTGVAKPVTQAELDEAERAFAAIDRLLADASPVKEEP
jgi:hypothetical protein